MVHFEKGVMSVTLQLQMHVIRIEIKLSTLETRTFFPAHDLMIALMKHDGRYDFATLKRRKKCWLSKG